MTNNGHIVIETALGILILVLSVCLFRQCTKEPEYIEHTTTLTDTIYQERIIEHTKPLYITSTDTCYVVKQDTLFKNDTVIIEIPITHYQYQDTIDNDSVKTFVDIRYFGYKAGIEQIGITNQITYKTPIQRKKQWNVGLQAGFGCQYGTISKQFDVGPYIGLGLSYGFDF